MKKDYIVRQNDIKDCGVCALESIIKYYKGYIPIETLRIDTNTTKDGTNAYNLIKTAKKYGLNGVGKQLNKLDNNIYLPAIAHFKLDNGLEHFVVIYKITNKYIKIMDPAKGYIKMNIDEFYKLWTHTLLILIPYKEIPKIKKNKTTLSVLLNILHIENKLFKKMTIYNLSIIILSIILSYYFKIISNSITTNYINTTLIIMISFLFINLIKIYLTYIKNEYIIYLEKNIDLSLIIDFIIHIFNLPLNVIKSRTSGEIITRVNELSNIKTLFIEIISNIIPNIILSLVSIFFLYSISNILFYILCIISLLYIIIGIITSPILYRKINDNIDLETEFNSDLIEKIDGIESIKNINKTKYFVENISNKYVYYKRNNLSYKNYLNKTLYYKNLIYEIGTLLITTIGFIKILSGNITLVDLITFNTLLPFFINPIIDIINILPEFYFIKLSMIKITEFYQIDKEKINKINFNNGNIKINNLFYSYDDIKDTIKDFSVVINKNEHVHLVGPSGCGKSTLCKILNGTIKNYKGLVKIDDMNIKDINYESLKENITYISQNEKIFTDTLINNITLNDSINNSKLQKILYITGLNKVLDKKELKLNTYLYGDSNNLSGGEKQRILLARALARKPKILILDESFSELDKKSELSILKKLNKFYKDTTIIYISHSNIRYFKKIIEV